MQAVPGGGVRRVGVRAQGQTAVQGPLGIVRPAAESAGNGEHSVGADQNSSSVGSTPNSQPAPLVPQTESQIGHALAG